MPIYEDPNNLILDAKSKLKPVVNNASKPSETSISNGASGDHSDHKAYVRTMKSEHEGNEDHVASAVGVSFTKGSNVLKEHEGNEEHVASAVGVSFTKGSNVLKELEVPSIEQIHFDADVTQTLMHDRGSSLKVQLTSKAENSGRFKCTVPQPFILATDMRASRGCKFTAATISNNDKKHINMNNTESPNLAKKSQASLHLESRKPPQPKITKHIVEEDVCSVNSLSTASVKAFKSRTTVAYAPIFRVSERAEKWIEFYSKLEEKQATIEAERIKYEARKKDEEEAALKELRKSMNFKATPMPSFYHEGPPPKTELKKIPVTRAKSPKFCRRRRRADANNPSPANDDRTNHHSFDITKNSKKSRRSIKNGTESCGVEAANDHGEPMQTPAEAAI